WAGIGCHGGEFFGPLTRSCLSLPAIAGFLRLLLLVRRSAGRGPQSARVVTVGFSETLRGSRFVPPNEDRTVSGVARPRGQSPGSVVAAIAYPRSGPFPP